MLPLSVLFHFNIAGF